MFSGFEICNLGRGIPSQFGIRCAYMCFIGVRHKARFVDNHQEACVRSHATARSALEVGDFPELGRQALAPALPGVAVGGMDLTPLGGGQQPDRAHRRIRAGCGPLLVLVRPRQAEVP